MKLSIIVPVYNMVAGGKLEYCLNSLINQTIDDYEIITVDDGSTDESLALLEKYAEQYPNILKVISLPENICQGGAKNAGLEVAKGEYIGFIDSDDWILPEMYQKLISAAETNDADIAACHLCLVDEHTMQPTEAVPSITPDLTGEITANKFRDLMFCFGALVTKVYRRDIFMHPVLRFPEKMFYEDNALSVEILSRAKRIALVDEPMYFYLQNSSSTTHTISERRCNDRMEAMRIMLKYAINGNYLEPFFPEIEYRFTELFYKNTLFGYMQTEKRVRLGYVKSIAAGMKETFPDFANNTYYLKKTNNEERRMLSLCTKSAFVFVVYYKLLWGYRNLKKRK